MIVLQIAAGILLALAILGSMIWWEENGGLLCKAGILTVCLWGGVGLIIYGFLRILETLYAYLNYFQVIGTISLIVMFIHLLLRLAAQGRKSAVKRFIVLFNLSFLVISGSFIYAVAHPKSDIYKAFSGDLKPVNPYTPYRLF